MKRIVTLCTLLFLLFFTNNVEAQFFKKLQKKIEKKIEKRLEKKTDEKADQALDSVFENKPRNKRRRQTDDDTPVTESSGYDLNGMMDAVMNREPAKYDQSYSFTFSTTMEMTTPGQAPLMVKTSYGDGVHYVEMKQGTSIINDFNNKSMITINEDNKTAQAMSLALLDMFNKEKDVTEDVDLETITVTNTGKTKNIRGYQCKQHIIKGKDFTTDGWFTQDVDFDMTSHAQSMSDTFKNASGMIISQKELGFPIEMISETANGETVVMKVLDVKNIERNIDLSTYKVTQL